MTYRESNVGTCDICLDTDAFITDADDDNNICDKCLDLQMSKDLEEIETDRGAFSRSRTSRRSTNSYQARHARQSLQT